MSDKASYSNHGFPWEARLDVPSESNKALENKNLKFKEWLAKLSLLSKDFCKEFEVFEEGFKVIPETWIDIKAHYTAEEAVEAKLDDTGVLSTILKAKINNGMHIIQEWVSMKPKVVAFMLRAMTDASLKRVEERDREAWLKAIRTNDILSLREQIRKSQIESGKATTLKDKKDARDSRQNIKLKSGERFEDFIKRIADADYMCEIAGVTIPLEELKYAFLQEMQNYPNVATHILANQYLQILVNESEDPTYPKDNAIKDIPTMADAFRATLIVSNRTESQMLSNKFTINHIESQFDSNHSNPTETIKVNGKEGFKINDNTYEIFQFDAQGKFTGTKRFTSKKNKHGKIGLKPVNTESAPNKKKEVKASTTGKTKSQIAVEKIVKEKGCTYKEARKLYGKCNKCGIDGHHQADCKVKNKDEPTDESSKKKAQDPINKGSSYFSALTDSDEDRCVYSFHAAIEVEHNADNVSVLVSSRSEHFRSLHAELTHYTDSNLVSVAVDEIDIIPDLVSDSDDEVDDADYSNGNDFIVQHYVDDIVVTRTIKPKHDLTNIEPEPDKVLEYHNSSDDNDSIPPNMDFIKTNYDMYKDITEEEHYHASIIMSTKHEAHKLSYSDNITTYIEYNKEWSTNACCFLTQQELKDQDSYNLLLLDSAANISAVCNPNLIPKVKELDKKFVITHFGGQTTVTHGGMHPILGQMLLRSDLKINIIALCALEEAGYDEYTAKDKSRKVFKNDLTKHIITFHKHPDKMYKCTASVFIDTMKDMYFSQVKECYGVYEGVEAYNLYNYIATYYTMDQQRRAQEAIRLHQALDHPSDSALEQLLVSPSAINGSLTPQDLKNARDMYGPCQHCLEGKPIAHKGSHSGFDPTNTSQQPGEIIHADIVFIGDKQPTLMSSDDYTNYNMIAEMDSKSSNECIKALDYVIARYQQNLKVVRMIITDSEFNLTSKAVELHLAAKGIKQCQSIPKEHEKSIERQVRIIREKMEAKLSELPFILPLKHYFYLAEDIINKNNILPNAKTTPRTPKEMVENVKFNFHRDMSAVFGAAVVVTHAKSTITNHSPQEIGVCMGEARRVPGAILVLCPSDTQDVPKPRRVVNSAIMTKDIIEWMNRKAAEKPIPANMPAIRTTQLALPYSEDGRPTPNPANEHLSNEEPNESIDVPTFLEPTIPVEVPKQLPIVPPIIEPTSAPLVVPPVVPLVSEANSTTNESTLNKKNVTVDKMEEPVATRRSSRQADPKYKNKAVFSKAGINLTELNEYLVNVTQANVEHRVILSADQYTFQQAMASEHQKEAKAACIMEMKGLMDRNSWKYLRNISDRKESVHNVITVPMMLVGMKYNAKGEFTKCKGRLVSGGHRTDPNSYDPLEKHSPTVPIEVANLQLGIASYTKAQVETYDIPVAYLNAMLKEGRYQVMRIPKHLVALILEIDPSKSQFVQSDGTMLVEVVRALYGFPESAKLWNELITDTLIKGGYKQCPVEPCLFRRHIDINTWSILTIYVDDCLHVFKSTKMKTEFLEMLKRAKLPDPTIQELSMTNDISYLGINISRVASDKIILSQPGFIEDILEKFPPEREYKTPHTEDLFNRPHNEDSRIISNITKFLSVLMKLMFLALRTRPDILLPVNSLSTKAKQPTYGDASRIDRVLGYLKHTKDLKLVCHVTDLSLKGYFDASHAVYPDMKGVNGILITLGNLGFPIVCKSSKQKSVYRSSTESELGCVFTGGDLLLYIRRLCVFLGTMGKDEAVDIYQDNTSAIKMSYMGRGSSQSNSKFVDIKYFWLKEHLDNKLFIMKYLQRENMIADFFASPRIGKIFSGWRDTILGTSK